MRTLAYITVPSAEALVTALGTSARDALATLAKSLAQQIEMCVDFNDRMRLISQFRTTVVAIERIDDAKVREARTLARSEAAIDWMARRDEARATEAARRAAEKLARERPSGPASSVVTDILAARSKKAGRGA